MKTNLARPMKQIRLALIYIILTVGGFVMIFPLLWTLSTSLKTLDAVSFAAETIQLIPDPVAWENYPELFKKFPMMTFLLNTLKVVIPGLFGAIITCSLAGFAFASVSPGAMLCFWSS